MLKFATDFQTKLITWFKNSKIKLNNQKSKPNDNELTDKIKTAGNGARGNSHL